MKKWYRMGICLVLAICLLILPACQIGDSLQTTGENNESTNQVTEPVALNWTEKYISFFGSSLWAEDLLKSAKVLDYESYIALMDECVSRHGACTVYCGLYSQDDGLCPWGRAFRNDRYTKEFFDTHSLIVLGLSSGSGSTIFDLRSVTYTGGVLSCAIDIPYYDWVFQMAAQGSWFCFVAVDTILPLETEVVFTLESAEYDYETYQQKEDQFHEKCSP